MIRTCPSCQSQNRIPLDRLSDTARCGACKTSLGPLDTPLDVDTREFGEIVRSAKVPILVDFWAPWCGPCRMAAPEVARAAQQTAGRALVLKVNSDDHPELAARFGVRGIPHFAILRNGKPLISQAGLVRSSQLVDWLERAAASQVA